MITCSLLGSECFIFPSSPPRPYGNIHPQHRGRNYVPRCCTKPIQASPWGYKMPDSAQGKPEGPFQDTHLQVKDEGCWGRLMSPISLENDPFLFLNERLTGCAPGLMLGRNQELQPGHFISCDPHNHLRTTHD